MIMKSLLRATDRARTVLHQWFGSIGCRVSFFMAAALIIVTGLVGVAFYLQERSARAELLRLRGDRIAADLARGIGQAAGPGARHAIARMVRSLYDSHEKDDEGASSDLEYVIVYTRDGELIAAGDDERLVVESAAFREAGGRTAKAFPGVIGPDTRTRAAGGADVITARPDLYDVVVPVPAEGAEGGFVRVGVSGSASLVLHPTLAGRMAVVLAAIVVIAVLTGQIITLNLTRRIHRLTEATARLGIDGLQAPLPVSGNDEISRLSRNFNDMAGILKQRESSLSTWNRDLFVLHTAGLELMESLDLGSLPAKILTRAEDLVHGETLALTAIDPATRLLRYTEVIGRRAQELKARELPLEAGGIFNWLASYGTPVLIADAQTDFRLDRGEAERQDIHCVMTVPLWTSNRLSALLTAVNKKDGGSFDRHDLRLFTVYASLAGAALQNASLFTELKRSMDELKDAQEQLVHSSKMAAIGELAANVAHEINNPLTGVLGYTSHLIRTASLPEESRRIIGMMEQETLRVRKIIRNLLDFSRHRPAAMRPGDLAAPVRESVALVQGVAEASAVRVFAEYPADPVTVVMDHNEMKQVFINILYNALQAMPEGGDLSVRLLPGPPSEAVVEIRDTGVGIAPEHRDRIFDPFFSTKESGAGTGLGLSISYRIVQNHGGRIDVASRVGHGTVFQVVLPLHRPVLEGGKREVRA